MLVGVWARMLYVIYAATNVELYAEVGWAADGTDVQRIALLRQVLPPITMTANRRKRHDATRDVSLYA